MSATLVLLYIAYFTALHAFGSWLAVNEICSCGSDFYEWICAVRDASSASHGEALVKGLQNLIIINKSVSIQRDMRQDTMIMMYIVLGQDTMRYILVQTFIKSTELLRFHHLINSATGIYRPCCWGARDLGSKSGHSHSQNSFPSHRKTHREFG